MRLASQAGLETARVEIGVAGDIQFLQVERYDRRELSDGRIERIHQEDFCQALGVSPELKYQQEGGPNLKKCFELVRSVCSIPGPDLLRLFDAVVLNYLIGNCDAHGKNFSLLREGTTVRLSPLYDLVSTHAYPELRFELMLLNGHIQVAFEKKKAPYCAGCRDPQSAWKELSREVAGFPESPSRKDALDHERGGGSGFDRPYGADVGRPQARGRSASAAI